MKRTICIALAIFLSVISLFADGTGLHVVVIDAGHGGKDPGAVSSDKKTYEKSIVLDIAKNLSERIRKAYPDVKVVMTRSSDKYVTLNDRAEIANKADADLFISIHINASAKNSPNGYSVHSLGQSSDTNKDLFAYNMDVCRRENSVITLEDDYTTKYQGFDPSDPESFIFMTLMQNSYLEQSMKFAQVISRSLKGGPIKADRGIWQNPYYVLWKTSMPAVLVELGFISNPTDLSILRRSSSREELGLRLFNAFVEYKQSFDESIRSDAPSGQAAKDSLPAPATSAKSPDALPSDTSLYAIQALVSSRRLASSDPVFKGYEVICLPVGNLFKYFLCPANDLDKVSGQLKDVRKYFSDAFLVKIDGQAVQAVKN